MLKQTFKYFKFVALALALPFIYGCGSDSGTGALSGFLFGGGGLNGSEIALLETTGTLGGGAGLATLHQPEPASMLLVGGGLMAMGYFKSKTKTKSRIK